MSKQRLNIGVDSEVYIKAKASKINLSETINELLKKFFAEENIESDEATLVQEEREIQEKIKVLIERKNQIVVNLVKLQEEKAKTQKEQFENAVALSQSMKNAGVLDDD